MQGVTEFLPVSSSGHLVILQNLFGMVEPQLLFDVLLHVATLAAILVVFREDIGELARAGLRIVREKAWDQPEDRLLIAIAVGCVPTALIGVGFSEHFRWLFASITAAGIGLLVTGFLLMGTWWTCRGRDTETRRDNPGTVSLFQALAIGAAQGLAIAPGVSRSGSTIAVALLLGLPRELAARFSFLLSIPAIIGALIFEQRAFLLPGAMSTPQPVTASMIAGAIVAAGAGIVSLIVLLGVVKRGRIFLFAYYCWLIGVLAIVLGVTRG